MESLYMSGMELFSLYSVCGRETEKLPRQFNVETLIGAGFSESERSH